MKMNWINLWGNTTFDKGKLTYHPTPAEDLQIPTHSSAFTKSDVYFENGEIEFSVMLQDASSACQLVFNQGLKDQNESQSTTMD